MNNLPPSFTDTLVYVPYVLQTYLWWCHWSTGLECIKFVFMFSWKHLMLHFVVWTQERSPSDPPMKAIFVQVLMNSLAQLQYLSDHPAGLLQANGDLLLSQSFGCSSSHLLFSFFVWAWVMEAATIQRCPDFPRCRLFVEFFTSGMAAELCVGLLTTVALQFTKWSLHIWAGV